MKYYTLREAVKLREDDKIGLKPFAKNLTNHIKRNFDKCENES